MARILAIEEATHEVVAGKRGKPARDFAAIVAEFATLQAGEVWIERASAKASLTAKPNKTNPNGGFLERFTAANSARKTPLKFKSVVEQGASGSYYLKLTRA